MKKSVGSPEQEVLQGLLRQMRARAGLTQKELADRLNTLQTIVSNFETGERRLDILELRQVCDALGIGLNEFVSQLNDALKQTISGR